jgi:hypothetical protein
MQKLAAAPARTGTTRLCAGDFFEYCLKQVRGPEGVWEQL